MTSPQRQSDRLWGGRFDQSPDAVFDAFQRSFPFDQRLLPYEFAVDRAWAKALAKVGVLDAAELRQLLEALDRFAARLQREPQWLASFHAEDLHHFVERELVRELGALGYKLHTARSRNELIAADFRLFIKNASAQTTAAIITLLRALLAQAKANIALPMAGMTHMQHAQPILLSHFLLAHAEAFLRDTHRLEQAADAADACPMGSGALAGCALPIDRGAIAAELGFSCITANSLDAVSDRDFALDYLFALAGIATHLSRLAEDFVLFASQEFAYAILPDQYATGSSLMPQKKNPDSWELIRGKSGRINGALVALLTTLKGLPTSYQRDLQEDKEALFGAHDQINQMLAVATGALAGTRFDEARLRAAASDPTLLATEAADYLVRKGVPFRQAHDFVGQALRQAEKRNMSFTQLPLDTLKAISPAFDSDFAASLTLEAALASKKVPGGTAPDFVHAAIAELEKQLQTWPDPTKPSPGEGK
jgi:argininosuccinate lyase